MPTPSEGGAGRASGHFQRLLIGELANKAFRFTAAAVLARALTESEFGRFNIGIAFAGIVVTVCSLGLAEIGARELARHPEDAARLAGRVLLARLVAFALAAGVGLVLVSLFWSADSGFALAIAGMALFMVTTGEWFARGLERMVTVAAGTAAGGLMALAGAAIVLAASGSVTDALICFAVAEFVASAIYWTAARGRLPRVGANGIALLLRESWPIALSSLAVFTFYANIDTIIIGATRSEAEAGIYSAAYRVFLAFNVVAIFGAYSLYPLISRASDVPTIGALIERTSRFLGFLVVYGAAIVGLGELAADEILGLLFGAPYRQGADAFVLLCISTSWYCVGYTVGYNLIAIGRSRRFSTGAAVAGGLALALDAALIPAFGMVGAGVATTASIIIAAGIWLGREGLATQAAKRLVGGLGVITAGAVIAVAIPQAQVPLGVFTLGLAAAGALRMNGLALRSPE